MGSFEEFLKLHQDITPLLLANSWDIPSAKVFEASGYKAIGTSSQALALAYGYDDGEQLPFEILLQFAKKVVEVTNVPFSMDIEGGYSRTVEGIVDNISKLHDAGVVGINLEDTIPGDARQMLPAADFQKTLSAVAEYLSRNHLKVFLNVRTDGFLLGMPNALEETLTRIKMYENTGAHGIFVPCITGTADIREVVNATRLPINVMCMPNLPDFDELAKLGVKRISMGPFLFNKAYDYVAKLAKTVLGDRNFSSVTS